MIVLTTDEGAVRTITLNRPDKLNSFNTELYGAAAAALQDAATDDTVSVVVFTGAGRAFSAGQDLEEMAALASGASDKGSDFPAFVDAIQAFPKPIIAAVNGVAVGIGMTLLPHCDLVLVDENARMRTPFTALGVAPEAASSVLFPARMGWQQAARILFTSDWVTAPEAVELGLALRVCAAGTVVAEAQALAATLAQFSVASLRATKQAMLDAQLPIVQRARGVEDAAFAKIFADRRNEPGAPS